MSTSSNERANGKEPAEDLAMETQAVADSLRQAGLTDADIRRHAERSFDKNESLHQIDMIP